MVKPLIKQINDNCNLIPLIEKVKSYFFIKILFFQYEQTVCS